jgi:cobalt/nickel transport system permease protein
MSIFSSDLLDFGILDLLAQKDTVIHRINAMAKLLTTLIFIILVTSYNRYAILPLMPYFVFPVVLLVLADLPPRLILQKVLLAAPFTLFVGILNPFFDTTPMLQLGTIYITGGFVSFLSIFLRMLLCVTATLLLIATTPFHEICHSLRRLGIPKPFVAQLMLLHRYLFIIAQETSRLLQARDLRSFEGRGKELRYYIPMVGQLLLRSLNRAQRLHAAMLSRGFTGEIHILNPAPMGHTDIAFLIGWSGVFFIFRTDIPTHLLQKIGALFLR